MVNNMSYCPGRNCTKRDQCQKHHNQGQVIDWSTYGSGYAGMKDSPMHENYVMFEIHCGDDGTYGYTRFEQYIPPEKPKTNF